jgi:phosphatidylglycerophosphate synthase
MLDKRIRPLIDRPLAVMGQRLAARGVSADQVTLAAFAAGMAGALAIGLGQPLVGLVLILVGRLADGLDGAVARATRKTDRGGYLDITLDFFFYGAVPLAFAFADPALNALAAAALIASFLANGAAFLAFAVMAERRGLETRAQGEKSLFYMMGLVEGTETVAFFVAFCLLPDLFPRLAGAMAALCTLSAAARVVHAYRVLEG